MNPERTPSINLANHDEMIRGVASLRYEADELRAQRNALLEACETASSAIAIQALRDCGDPDMLKGWRRIQDQLRAAIENAKSC